MKIRHPRLLRFFGFNVPDGENAEVSMPLSMWIRCLFWRRMDERLTNVRRLKR